jgi:tetratricopeptide (TPR) repeat protein
VSCLAEQAKILFAEALENNLGPKAFNERWERWHACGLCEQRYHGVVRCALGWACWKTYLGRPETEQVRHAAMSALGNGLYAAKHYEDAMVVQEAELSMKRRIGESDHNILAAMGNLAATYAAVGDLEKAISMEREVYSGRLKLEGEEQEETLRVANNYAASLVGLQRFEEAKSLLRKIMPVARRVLGEGNRLRLKMRKIYAWALYSDPAATLEDLREAVTTLEDAGRIARRVFGGANPLTVEIEEDLQHARAALRVRETLPPGTR